MMTDSTIYHRYFPAAGETASLLIPVDHGTIHTYALLPRTVAKRMVTIVSGLGHSVATQSRVINSFLAEGTGVLFVEPRGHGPYSSAFDSGNTRLMARDLDRVYNSPVLGTWLYSHPILRTVPFHELGFSMGGGTLVDAELHAAQPRAVHFADSHRVPIASITLVNPRVGLGDNYSWLTRRVLAPSLGWLRQLSPQLFDAHVRIPFPRSFENLPPKEAALLRQLQTQVIQGKPAILKTLPNPYITDVFAHDRRLKTRWSKSNATILPRLLMMLDPNDTECKPGDSLKFFATQAPPKSRLMRILDHNPFNHSLQTTISAITEFHDDVRRALPCTGRRFLPKHYYLQQAYRGMGLEAAHGMIGMILGSALYAGASNIFPQQYADTVTPIATALTPFLHCLIPSKTGVTFLGYRSSSPWRGVVKSETLSLGILWGLKRMGIEGWPAEMLALGGSYIWDITAPMLRGIVIDYRLNPVMQRIMARSAMPIAILCAGILIYQQMGVRTQCRQQL